MTIGQVVCWTETTPRLASRIGRIVDVVPMGVLWPKNLPGYLIELADGSLVRRARHVLRAAKRGETREYERRESLLAMGVTS